MNKNKVEILAPAGSYDTFLAVLNAGADAVYLGGQMFGARAYAGNLSSEEVVNAINYAHIHNKKLYLTVNTLLKNNELFNGLYEYIKPFYEVGLDGVIVQDYGVMKFIHDNFPDMEIHASTQMTVTDSYYKDFLKKYNVTRIVPARELSLEDIRMLRQNTDFEIECFVHGALCYCYSGMCFMSSFIGGRSGNRGRCAQPCRLNYSGDNILSLKDLCTLDILPDILEAGVFSLKIEGRMKSTEYAAGVTSIYRKYVDMYLKNGRAGYKVDKDDYKKLLMLFDRGGMTTGYYVMHNGKDMIADSSKASKSLEAKDKFEKEIIAEYTNNILKEKINISAKILKNRNAVIVIEDEKGNKAECIGDMAEQAKNKAMTFEDVKKQLIKLGNTDFVADNTDIIMDEDIFISNKSLNELRRMAVTRITEEILKPYSRVSQKVSYNFSTEKTFGGKITARVLTTEQAYSAILAGSNRLCIECEMMSVDDFKNIIKKCHDNDIQCFYGMPRVFKNDYKDYLKDSKLMEQLKFDGYYVRNMSEFQFLKNNNIDGIKVADYTVYGFNNLAVEVLYDYGFDEVTYPVELNEKELFHLKNPNGELIIYGKIPLMVSANCIDKTCHKCHKPETSMSYITDRKGMKLPYVSCCKFCYNIIYNNVPAFLTDKMVDIEHIGVKSVSLCFTDENKDEVYRNIIMARDAMDNIQVDTPLNFTRGHFTRGVE